jgi:hypothetical protein
VSHPGLHHTGSQYFTTLLIILSDWKRCMHAIFPTFVAANVDAIVVITVIFVVMGAAIVTTRS